MIRRVAILISGNGSNMLALAKSMTADHPARPCVVISDNPEAKGLARAAKRGLRTVTISSHFGKHNRLAFEKELIQCLEKFDVECVCLAGFMRILTAQFVRYWNGRILNIHPSLLPKFRGLQTHARALVAGEKYHGCTVHQVTEHLDHGPILGQAQLTVSPEDTTESLSQRVLRLEHELYPIVLRRFVGGDRRLVVL